MTANRKARQFVWVDPLDCFPPHGLDMQSKRDYDKVAFLREAFEKSGFDHNEPALIGYPLDNGIQLLTGTHRHLAAKQAGIKLPVSLWLRSDIERTWGTELWTDVIADIPVRELEEKPVEDGFKIPPYDRVQL